MSSLPADRLSALSANARRERARLQNHVRAGGSLAILLREQRPELERVEVQKLLRWLPLVGPLKSMRMAYGLPLYTRTGDLTPHQRERLVTIIANRERRYLNRSLRTPHQEA